MIGYDELRSITRNADELYPPMTDEGHREWWAERGVDYDGLVEFCAEDGTDSLVNSLPKFVGTAPAPSVLSAGFAMSTEVGFLIGWIACEQHIRRVGMDT